MIVCLSKLIDFQIKRKISWNQILRFIDEIIDGQNIECMKATFDELSVGVISSSIIMNAMGIMTSMHIALILDSQPT